jgi:hypothetical protein
MGIMGATFWFQHPNNRGHISSTTQVQLIQNIDATFQLMRFPGRKYQHQNHDQIPQICEEK